MTISEKNVLIIIPSLGFGGAELHSLGLAGWLQRAGNRVTCAFPVVSGTLPLLSACTEQGLSVLDAPVSLPAAASILEAAEEQAQAVSASLSPDEYDIVLVAAPSPVPALGVAKALSSCRVPTCIVFHLVAQTLTFSKAERSHFLRTRRPGVRWVCVSEFTRDMLARALSLDDHDSWLQYIPNGVPDAYLRPEPRELAQELGRPGSPIVAVVGRLHPQKGAMVLLEAIPRVLEMHPEVHFVWFGEGILREKMSDKAHELGVGGAFSMPGFTSEPAEVFRAADLIVLPSLYEGLSLSLLEAMRAGAAIVTTDTSYQDRLLSHRIDAGIARVADPESLAEEINYALADPNVRARYREKVRRKGEYYTEKRMLSDYSELLDELMSDSRCGIFEDGLLGGPALRFEVESAQVVLTRAEGHPGDEEAFELVDLLAGRCKLADPYRGDVRVYVRLPDGAVKPFGSSMKSGIGASGDILNVLSAVMDEEHENGSAHVAVVVLESVLSQFVEHAHLLTVEAVRPLAHLFGRCLGRMEARGGALSSLLFSALPRLSKAARHTIIDVFTGPPFCPTGEEESWHLQELLCQLRGDDLWGERQAALRAYHGNRGDALLAHPYWDPRRPSGSTASRRVVVFAAYFNYPTRNGGDCRVLSVIEGYRALGYEVTLFRWVQPGQEVTGQAVAQALRRRLGVEVQSYQLTQQERERYAVQFANLSSGHVDFAGFFDERLLAAFRLCCELLGPDVVHINYCYFSYLLLATEGSAAHSVLDSHDIISRRSRIQAEIKRLCGNKLPQSVHEVKEHALNANHFLTLPFELDASEHAAYGAYDSILMISPVEREIMKRLVPEAPLHYVPYRPSFAPTCQAVSEPVAFFVGSRNPINLVAASVVQRNLAERLSAYSDDFAIHAAGDVCEGMNGVAGLVLHGRIPSIDAAYNGVSISLCPTVCGTGQNIKITEALSRGVPVATFGESARAASVVAGENGLVAQSVDDLREQLTRFVLDGGMRRSLRSRAGEWAREVLREELFLGDLEKALTVDASGGTQMAVDGVYA